MKTLITAVLIMTSATALAHEITGTPVLLGTARGSAVVRGQPVECRVKLEDGLFGRTRARRNLLEEDRFGNPAYIVTAKLEIDSPSAAGGRSGSSSSTFRHRSTLNFINLHQDAEGKIVRDDLYVGQTETRANFVINGQGSIRTAAIPTEAGVVNCRF